MHQHNLTDGHNSMQVALIGLLAMPGACAKTRPHTGPFDLDDTADLKQGGVKTCVWIL